jgi:hypothetical protein
MLAKGIKPFVDALPIPATMPVMHRIAGVAIYDVAMVPVRQKLHRDLAPTTLWGYHGACPGPTIEARSGAPVRVLWRNALPPTHALRIDTAIHGAEPDKPAVRTVVHVHGLKVLPDSDGYPDAWFTTEFAQTGPFFKNRIYEYPNDQRAATLWYHDHAIGITRLNIYMGLVGLYILRDDIEDSLNLPSGMYEIPLIIQDRNVAPDGSLVYPAPTVPPIAEFFGESVLVNGKIWPYLTVEPRKYRFRILNASNARFYRLRLVESDEAGQGDEAWWPVLCPDRQRWRFAEPAGVARLHRYGSRRTPRCHRRFCRSRRQYLRARERRTRTLPGGWRCRPTARDDVQGRAKSSKLGPQLFTEQPAGRDETGLG